MLVVWIIALVCTAALGATQRRKLVARWRTSVQSNKQNSHEGMYVDIRALQHRAGINLGKPSSPALAVTPWEYPEPEPDTSFDLEKTPPPDFRAFRYSYKRQ